jgi:hypothetical protein
MFSSDIVKDLLKRSAPLFRNRYFNDLSFFLAGLAFGSTTAVQMKFSLVDDMINHGNRAAMDRTIAELPDLCATLAEH